MKRLLVLLSAAGLALCSSLATAVPKAAEDADSPVTRGHDAPRPKLATKPATAKPAAKAERSKTKSALPAKHLKQGAVRGQKKK